MYSVSSDDVATHYTLTVSYSLYEWLQFNLNSLLFEVAGCKSKNLDYLITMLRPETA